MAKEPNIFDIEHDDDVLVIMPRGDTLPLEELVLEAEVSSLHKLIDQKKIRKLIVDIGNAPFFGSLLIGAILGLCKKVSDQDGLAVMCNASEGMRESIRIMKLDTVIPYYEARAEALASLTG